jgi:hypothetical protein
MAEFENKRAGLLLRNAEKNSLQFLGGILAKINQNKYKGIRRVIENARATSSGPPNPTAPTITTAGIPNCRYEIHKQLIKLN